MVTSAIIYGLLITFINSVFELTSFNTYNVCLCREKAESPKLLFTFITTTLPQLTIQLTIIILDISCFYLVKKQKNNRQKSKVQKLIYEKHSNILTEIPFRASLISTSIFLLQVLGHIVIASRLQPLEKYAFVIILVKVTSIWKNPLIATFTFRVNEENRKRNADEERERKRQWEIQDAVKRKQERIAMRELG